jgi:nifR3 family TIM-barrel protein
MVEAAKIVELSQPNILDINFGCPVKKIASKGAGAGMLRDIPKLLEITREVVKAVKIPVTVKTRLGWDDNSKIIITLALQLQDCGIEALAIHGRTRAQMYTGIADWTLIGEVKNNQAIKISIIGNGDVTTAERAKECFAKYNVDAVMIGRGAIGCPWIFAEIKNALLSEKNFVIPANFDKKIILKNYILKCVEYLGNERKGIIHARRHIAATPLFKNIANFRHTRIAMLQAVTIEELFGLIENI